MEILITILHVLVAFLLVITILLQSGKGGGLAGSLGGGGMDSSVLGGRTAATFMVKATSVLATVFILSCLVQSIVFQSSNEVPTSATERMLEGVVQPVTPISETPGFLEPATSEGGAVEVAPAGGTDAAAKGAAE